MSMTQVAILKKANLPKLSKIENDIQHLGYDFKIVDVDGNAKLDENGIVCTINGHQTFLETYIDQPSEIVHDFEFIKSELSDEDLAISFVWGTDFAAAACIGLISISLIDNCNALIYYLDDELRLTKKMLLEDTPICLNELAKISKD